ncbi:MAG TPA: hypothetical protein VGP65_18670 [Candidatus Angelobacter sp.]|nr:hypothetical protein [Candidatus Angelobacter sp.]
MHWKATAAFVILSSGLAIAQEQATDPPGAKTTVISEPSRAPTHIFP